MDTIQSFWTGKIGTMELLSMASYVANGHPYHLYSYAEPDGLPDGVVLCDANEILPQSDQALFRYPAHFADWFRFNMLYKKGGWWVDTDTVCLKPLEFDWDCVIIAEIMPNNSLVGLETYFKPHDFAMINNGMKVGIPFVSSAYLKFKDSEVDSVILEWIIDKCLDIFLEWDTMPWATLTPTMVWKAVQHFRLPVLPAEELAPVPGYLTKKFVEADYPLPDSSAIHLWHSGWSKLGIDTEGSHPPTCIYERLKAKYL